MDKDQAWLVCAAMLGGSMKNPKKYIVLGVVLIALGALALLQNLEVLNLLDLLPRFSIQSGDIIGALLISLLFAGVGLAFLVVFVVNLHQNWWAVIPGFTLVGLAALIAFGNRMGEAGAGMFLGAIGLSFLVIYLVRQEFWWAIIPGGVLLTLAIMIPMISVFPGVPMLGPAVLFFGLALTFLLVFLLPSEETRHTWALWPAGILAVIGLLLLLSLGNLLNILWATALIISGGYLLLRAVRQ
jgi:hypothetical protein